MRGTRRAAAAFTVAVTVLGLAACAPALPATVVPGTTVTAGWTAEFTSANAAAAPTRGNTDIAAATRAGFGELVDGEFVADSSFGTVSILSDDPFVVRYDLAEPEWSDGIPLDAADLLLGWAAASGSLDPRKDEEATDAPPAVPIVDEFARAIEVTYPAPVSDWQRRIVVAVPAHIVAARALGIDDPMAAKQALLTAIRDGDADALADIARVWTEGFTLPAEGEIPTDLLLSSGPFRVAGVTRDATGQRVSLVANSAYRGAITPKIATVDLVPAGDDPVAGVGEGLDVVQVAPRAGNRAPISALERRDLTVTTTQDGTVWALLLRPAGVFTSQAARAAFLRAIPAGTLVERGAAAWSSAYTPATSMLTAPGSRAYEIVNADSGFAAALTGAQESALERSAAGVAPGTRVCVLYDRGSEFAAGAFAAVRDAAQGAGWSAADCGTDDLAGAMGQNGWDAALVRVPIPQTPAQIADQWGGGGAASLVGDADPARDALIAQLAQTTDVYAARDLLAQIEATIVRAAVALPIAANPAVTIVDRRVTGVAARDGATAPLTWGLAQWTVVP